MLSLQVHPDDAYAAAHERAAGGRGKTEMWHIVSAEPDAQILLGLKPGVDKKAFLDGLENHTLESFFKHSPGPCGDTIFVPAGTPHAIGPGMIVCEVQEYSDLTYRVYDYGRVDAHGRPRELHIEKALEVTNFGATLAGKTKTSPIARRDRRNSRAHRCSPPVRFSRPSCGRRTSTVHDSSDSVTFRSDRSAFRARCLALERFRVSDRARRVLVSAGEPRETAVLFRSNHRNMYSHLCSQSLGFA